MPRIPSLTIQTAAEPNAGTLRRLREQHGRHLNIFGGMAHSTVVLQAYVALDHTLDEHSTYTSRTREAIALAVANENGCTYCEAAHTASGAAAGLSQDEMRSIRKGLPTDDQRLTALLTLARQYAANRGTVDDAAWDAALAAGWTEPELVELSAHVTVNIMTNYFNHLVGTEADIRPAPSI